MKLFWRSVPFLLALALASSLCAQRVITCSSDNGKRNFCSADTRSGALLVNQRSGSPCTFGQTWGFDRNGIWVDRGCRADFQIGAANSNWPGYDPNRPGYNIYCASDNGRRNDCATDTRGGVSLVRQRSGSPCTYGSTWGYNRSGIWVDRGCRADFQIRSSGWTPGGGSTVINCSSNDMKRRTCLADTSHGVRLIRQQSEADCIRGQTWGYNQNVIWVDRGCRADFEVGKFR